MSENNGNKENILKCALELFSSKGYEAVSVQELVVMAGITKPTLYYYFKSKEGVYEQLVKVNYEALDRVVLAASVYVPKPKSYYEDVYLVLCRLVREYFKFAKENELFYRMALVNLFQPCSSQIYDIIKTYHFKQYDIVSGMFVSFSNEHKNILGKEKMLAWTFLGMVNSFIGFYYNEFDNSELNDDTAIKLVRQFMHGIYS